MKSRADRLLRRLTFALVLGGAVVPALARDKAPPPVPTGPAADYPIVLGAPFTIDGVTYTPADTLNFDKVGYATIDPALGQGVSIAHRTLPLPSYAEITSLRTGRTILVRVERRGPLSGPAIVALSPAAAMQLGTDDPRTPIRIRRVNPAEPERALLRAGQPAPQRMDTPMSLVGVLLRKLDPTAPPPPAAAPMPMPLPMSGPGAVPATALPGLKRPAVMPPMQRPLPPADSEARPAAPASRLPTVTRGPAPAPAGTGAVVVQVGAYSSRASAAAVAARVGGAVSPAGRLFRVRIGGFANAAEAGAALAKARAAGYSEARIQRAD